MPPLSQLRKTRCIIGQQSNQLGSQRRRDPVVAVDRSLGYSEEKQRRRYTHEESSGEGGPSQLPQKMHRAPPGDYRYRSMSSTSFGLQGLQVSVSFEQRQAMRMPHAKKRFPN